MSDEELKTSMPMQMIVGLEAIICASMNTKGLAQIELQIGDRHVRVMACPMDYGDKQPKKDGAVRWIEVHDEVGELREVVR